MELLLGLDIGTTEVKAMAWDIHRQCQAAATRKVNLISLPGNQVEQDAKELWAAVVAVCARVAEDARSGSHRICALSVSTQGGTTIPVDRAGEPTHFAFSWMDERSEEEARFINAHLGSDRLYQRTGWPLTPGLPINQIAWFRKNQPEAFQRTARFMFVNDYILYRLGGEPAMDPSNAGITQLYNLAENDWDEPLLAIAGIHKDQLSPISPSGIPVAQLTQSAAALTGLPPGIPIINGAHDQYCAALGSGSVDPGDVLLSCGTAWVLLFVLDRLEKGLENGLSVSRHPVNGLFGGILDIGGVGSTVEWLIDHLWVDIPDRESRFRSLEQAVMTSPPGANGLLFVPLSGGFTQPGETLNRGPIGLSLGHSRADIARAVMEGITLELDLLLADVVRKIPIQRLVMIGGASRNPHWPQIIADITGLPVVVPQVTGAASLGAAILAGQALGWFPGRTPGHSNQPTDFKQVLPGADAQGMISRVRARYRRSRKAIPSIDPSELDKSV